MALAFLVFAFFTCESASDSVEACQLPATGSREAQLLADARRQINFNLLYPCRLPGATYLESIAVTGMPGRQQVELTFDGPFEMAVRQSQVPPPLNPDPTGASRTDIDLFADVRGVLIERNDGSARALYHLYWNRGGLFYEVQATGPPLQRRQILQVATSLQ